MKTHVEITLAGLLLLAVPAVAQTTTGVPQSSGANVAAPAVKYGPAARPAKNSPANRKPAQVASTAQRKPEAPATHSATTRSSPRTAQFSSLGQPTPALPTGYAPQTISAPQTGAPMSAPAGTPTTVDEGSVAGACGAGGGCGGCGTGNYPYGPINRHPLRWGWYVPFWHSTGDMPQHIPYFPNAHGYYYFHPYNVIHVVQQQEMVGRWGLDPRNPMDNRFLERIYQEQEAAQIHDGTQPVMPR